MNKYWIWFSRINKIGAKAQNKLLEKYHNPERIWNLTKEELQEILDNKQVEIVLNQNNRENLEKYDEYMQKHKIKMITILDEKYPKKLRNIYDPPVVLYVKGNASIIDNLSIAIIGSRICSNYGKEVAKQFAYNLSKHNINILSGLARGIDTYAHIGAIQAKEITIAVMGNGLDIIYPEENRKIYDDIIKNNGAINSDDMVGTKPEKLNFPARNRIVSGLSEGILVVEANKKSGAFITVDFALEQGKNIYAIPR